jgi:hypothetical protein
MSFNWYNINVHRNGGDGSALLEKPNKSGKYARRKDVEPLLARLQKEQRETKQSLKHIKYMIETFRSQFSKDSNEGMIHNCDMMLKKIDGFL